MLEVRGIRKSFGNKEVVKDVSFSVEKGEAFGLLGPNGAGKSTLISIISGLYRADSGGILLNHTPVKRGLNNVKNLIGVVPQEIALYPTMTAKENLNFWGRMYGLKGANLKRRIAEVLSVVGLTEHASGKIENFSGGMKRRVNIAAALIHEPKLLIMDEPTVGIDPQSRNHILETVKQLNQKGITVIYTSHYMEEVEFLCSRIAIMDHGKLIALGSKNELCDQITKGTLVQIKVDQVKEEVIDSLKELDNIGDLESSEGEIKLFVSNSEQLLSRVVSIINQSGSQLMGVNIIKPNLETLFLQLTGRALRD